MLYAGIERRLGPIPRHSHGFADAAQVGEAEVEHGLLQRKVRIARAQRHLGRQDECAAQLHRRSIDDGLVESAAQLLGAHVARDVERLGQDVHHFTDALRATGFADVLQGVARDGQHRPDDRLR